MDLNSKSCFGLTLFYEISKGQRPTLNVLPLIILNKRLGRYFKEFIKLPLWSMAVIRANKLGLIEYHICFGNHHVGICVTQSGLTVQNYSAFWIYREVMNFLSDGMLNGLSKVYYSIVDDNSCSIFYFLNMLNI